MPGPPRVRHRQGQSSSSCWSRAEYAVQSMLIAATLHVCNAAASEQQGRPTRDARYAQVGAASAPNWCDQLQ